MANALPSAEATKAVEKIVEDLTDRRGLRQGWENITGEIQEEIKAVWAQAIDDAFRNGDL